MPDLPLPDDLKRILGSLHGVGVGLRNAARGLRDGGPADGDGGALARQVERAARYVDQARRALCGGADEESPVRASKVPCLSGSSDAVPLSAVLSFLAGINASGVLRAYGVNEAYVLQFENGYLVYAHGDDPPHGMLLGELLVEQGAISRNDLRIVLESGWAASETLGGLLVREGHIRPEALEAALIAQIQNLGQRLFSQPSLRFRFYSNERVIEREDVRMNVMGLLLETARMHDEEQHASDGWTPPESIEFSAA